MQRNNLLFATTKQKILNFLAQNRGSAFFGKEIAQKTKLSAGATSSALKELVRNGLVVKQTKGKIHFYQVDENNIIVKQLKVLDVTTKLFPFIKEAQKFCKTIILFGSSARGEDYKDSDIDLLIVVQNSEVKTKIWEIRERFSCPEHTIVRTSAEFAKMEKTRPVFYQEITRGITLWEQHEES